MSRSRPRPAPARVDAAPPDPRRRDALLALAAAALAFAVFRGALGYFFAQDDFTGLARARGLAPAVPFPWRWLSGQAYFAAMRGVAGLHALPYHAVSLAAHAACTVLVYRLARRFVAPPAAALGAVFFGTHPAAYTALYSVSGIGEILAAALGVASLLAASRPGRAAWLAPPLFAAALLAKESVLLLPLVAWLLPAPGPGTEAPRRGPRLALAAIALAYAAAWAGRDVFGLRGALDPAAAYAVRFDRTLGENLLTYLGWAVPVPLPLVRSWQDAVEPAVFPAGALAGLALAAAAAVPALRARGAAAGAALVAAALAPVLPLAHHTYHYYLLLPLAGGALVVAALADLAASRAPARAAGLATAALAAALAVNGALLVRTIETMPFADPELRSDATVDRARIAANAIGDLRAAELPAGARLAFWSPASIDRQRAAGEDTARESYWEANVRVALGDGLAVRVCLPQVAEARFVRAFAPGADSLLWAVYRPDGHLRVGRTAELEAVLHEEGAR